jgi:hypothetical protein
MMTAVMKKTLDVQTLPETTRGDASHCQLATEPEHKKKTKL